MGKYYLLFIGVLSIFALLMLGGFTLLPRKQPMPQVQTHLPTSLPMLMGGIHTHGSILKYVVDHDTGI